MIYETNSCIELTRKSNKYWANFVMGMFPNQCTEDILSVLSAKEIEEYNGYLYEKRRNEFGFGRYVGKKSVSPFLKGQSFNEITIGRGVFSQPVLYYPNNIEKIQVSISHADRMAVSIAFPEEHPMGIDIEKVSDSATEALLKQMLEQEINLINTLEIPKNIGLTLLWTAKEALSKILKTGLTVRLSIFSIKEIEEVEGGFLCEFENFLQYKAFSWVMGGYICSICLPRNSEFSIDIEKIKAAFQEYPDFFT